MIRIPVPGGRCRCSSDGAFSVDGVNGTLDSLAAGSRVEVVNNAGHFLHLERPEVVNPMILDWIGG